MFSRRRHAPEVLMHVLGKPYDLDCEDNRVDFSNASLYLAGIQAVFSICVCSCVSVLSCWIVPQGGVSAVRTLALCSFFGAVLMRKPLRIGRAHGVTVVFDSLQPSVPLYLCTQVIEQLIHTCTSNDSSAPSWRRVIFHAMQLSLICAGFLRARRPMADTDLPFVLTVIALLVIAMLPPPSIALVGPLCQSVGLWEAVDRLIRAFTFAVLYAVNVYSITSSNGIYISETQVVVTRSASASIWVLGSHISWLPLAVLQCGLVIHARVQYGESGERVDRSSITTVSEYASIESAHSTDDDDAEVDMESNQDNTAPILDDPVAEQSRLLAQPQLYTPMREGIGMAGYGDGPLTKSTTSISLQSILTMPTLLSTTTTLPIPPRPQTPSEEVSRFGPRSFQNVNDAPVIELTNQGVIESDFHDRAAEIAERVV